MSASGTNQPIKLDDVRCERGADVRPKKLPFTSDFGLALF